MDGTLSRKTNEQRLCHVIGYQVGNDVGILTDRETVVSPTRNLETDDDESEDEERARSARDTAMYIRTRGQRDGN